MKTPRKTDPIDDLINELLRPIKLLRELKKAKQEIVRLTEVLKDEEEKYGKVHDMVDQITEQKKRIEYLEAIVEFYEVKFNATS